MVINQAKMHLLPCAFSDSVFSSSGGISVCVVVSGVGTGSSDTMLGLALSCDVTASTTCHKIMK